MKKNSFLVTLLIILSFVAGNFTGAYESKNVANAPTTTVTKNQPNNTFWNTPNKNTSALGSFWKVWDLLDQEFYEKEKLIEEERIYGAIKGMVNALEDPYTLYMDPKETKEFADSLEGKLEGIGAELTVGNGNLVVISPIKGTPAEKAGLKPKDIIYKIDDQITSEMTLYDAIMKIRGPKGSKVKLTIVRESKTQPIEITITRDSINVPSAEVEFKDKIAVISINQFNDSTMPEMNKIIGEILIKKPKGIIIDLRNNGGGYLDTSIDLLSEFLDAEQKAVVVKQRDETKNEILYSSGPTRLKGFPLAVLINEGTASASEIFAGAIQDYKKGLLIGEKSHGKGSVQQIDELEDGSSLRVTIAKWFTPNDTSIDKVGILPDREVKETEEDIKENKDPQMDEAISYINDL